MAIDRDGADAYFAAEAHVESARWLAFDEDLRAAAVAQGKANLTRLNGEALTEDETAITDSPRHDAAVYEYALILACNSKAVQDGDHASMAELSYEGKQEGNVKRMANPLTEKVLALMAFPMRIYRG